MAPPKGFVVCEVLRTRCCNQSSRTLEQRILNAWLNYKPQDSSAQAHGIQNNVKLGGLWGINTPAGILLARQAGFGLDQLKIQSKEVKPSSQAMASTGNQILSYTRLSPKLERNPWALAVSQRPSKLSWAISEMTTQPLQVTQQFLPTCLCFWSSKAAYPISIHPMGQLCKSAHRQDKHLRQLRTGEEKPKSSNLPL